MCVCAELPPPHQGDVCVLSEDGLSSGEAGGQSAHLPQLVFPLLTLQHQAEVRTWIRGVCSVSGPSRHTSCSLDTASEKSLQFAEMTVFILHLLKMHHFI